MKKIILLTALAIISMYAHTEGVANPQLISHFGNTAISFNGSKKTIAELTRTDPEFQKVALLYHDSSNDSNPQPEYLGTIGYPKCYSLFDWTSAIVGIQEKENGVIHWYEDQKVFVVSTDYMAKIAAAQKKYDAIEQEIERSSQ